MPEVNEPSYDWSALNRLAESRPDKDIGTQISVAEHNRLLQLQQACIDLLDAPHRDHFASRLGDEELAAVDKMKSLLKR